MSNLSNKSKSLTKDTFLFGISSFGSKLILFLLVPLYTAVLSTSDYGVADFITVTVELIYPVLTLGITDATLRFALSKENDPKKVLSISILFIFSSCVFLLLFTPLALSINNQISEYWLFFVLIYMLFNLHTCFSNFLKGVGKTSAFAIQGIIQTVALVLCNILFLLVFKYGLKGYLFSVIIGYFSALFFMFFAGQIFKYNIFVPVDKKLMLDMMKYSLPMIPTIMSWLLISSLDKYMIIFTTGLSESGIYSVAHKIPTILTTVLSVFIQAWQISAISHYGDNDESEYYTKTYRFFDLINLLMSFALIILSRLFSKLLFDEAYFTACFFVPFLIVSSVFSNNASFLASAFRASKKTMPLFFSVICGVTFNVLLNIALIYYLGTKGAAIATAISFFFVWLIRVLIVRSIVRVKVNVLVTIINYSLLVASAIFMTFEFKYYYIVSISCFVLFLLINVKTIIKLISSISNIFISAIAKKKNNKIEGGAD